MASSLNEESGAPNDNIVPEIGLHMPQRILNRELFPLPAKKIPGKNVSKEELFWNSAARNLHKRFSVSIGFYNKNIFFKFNWVSLSLINHNKINQNR